MASNSSTSSSELSRHERVDPGRVPTATIVFLVMVALIEWNAWTNREWFADLAAWQWESKRALIEDAQLNGPVAVFGTSVLFHGLDPTVANLESGKQTVVNLALNGMLLQHQAQFLRERLRSPNPPTVAVLELRQLTVERESWIRGPYFQFWASTKDFFESRFYYWNLPLALPFAANRVLTSLRYREALDNWISESLRAGTPAPDTKDRNQAVRSEMREHAGMVRADFEERTLAAPQGPERARQWSVDAAGELWLRQFLETATAHSMRIVLLVPPSPPHLVERPGPDGYRARLTEYIQRLQAEYPGLSIEVFEPAGYLLEDFSDEVHLSHKGRLKLSGDFAKWLSAYQSRTSTPIAESVRPPISSAAGGS